MNNFLLQSISSLLKLCLFINLFGLFGAGFFISNSFPINVNAQGVCCPINTQCGSLLGVYYGNQGFDIGQIAALENWQSKKNAVVTLFTNMDPNNTNQLFQTQLPNIWNNGNVPLITLEPFLASNTPSEIETQIANGDYDSFFSNWATQLQSFIKGPDNILGTSDDRRVYIRLGHEMNGNFYPWSAKQGVNSPRDYIAMWQKVYSILNQNFTKDQVQWIWSVNNVDVGAFTAEEYYPGDSYVDWLGIDGYNFGLSGGAMIWQTPQVVFDNMLARLRAISPTKPVAVNEIGSTTNNLGTVAKNNWISDAYDHLDSQNVKLISWFNKDKNTDWAVYGGSNGTEVSGTSNAFGNYKLKVSQNNLIASDTANPRLLTTKQFQGIIANSQTSCTIANIAPTISINSPLSNQNISKNSTFQITANANDVDGTITSVKIFDGSTSIGNAIKQGVSNDYILNISANGLAVGSHIITARATDNQNAQTTSSPITIIIQEPTCNNGATNPPNCNSCLSNQVLINGNCTVQIPVSQNILPILVFSPLTQKSIFINDKIELSGTMIDLDGLISQVSVYDNNQYIGLAILTNNNWTFQYSTSELGTHSLSIVAKNNQNGYTTSNIQNLDVRNSSANSNSSVNSNRALLRTGGQNMQLQFQAIVLSIVASVLAIVYFLHKIIKKLKT